MPLIITPKQRGFQEREAAKPVLMRASRNTLKEIHVVEIFRELKMPETKTQQDLDKNTSEFGQEMKEESNERTCFSIFDEDLADCV